MGSFWSGRSRAKPLCRGGNVSANSGKVRDKTENLVEHNAQFLVNKDSVTMKYLFFKFN